VSISKPQISIPSVRKGTVKPELAQPWNTANLGLRLGADLTSAASASALIAPVISVIDRYVHTAVAAGIKNKSHILLLEIELSVWSLDPVLWKRKPSHSHLRDQRGRLLSDSWTNEWYTEP
jgi:hypothetical protein